MFLLQMSGVPGSGKSTLAKSISEYIDVVIINTDIVKSAILDIVDDIDFKYAGKVTYNIAYALARDYLQQGKNVILDSPCLYNEGLQTGISLAKECNAQYKYIECFLEDLDEIDKRLRQRESYASQIKALSSDKSSIEGMRRAIYAAKRPEETAYLVVDTLKPLEEYIEEVIEYIKR